MKIFRNEFLKLWKNPVNLIVVFLLIFANIGFWLFTQSPQQISSFNYNEFSSLKTRYDKIEIKDSLSAIKDKISEISLFEQFEIYTSLPDVALNKKDFYDPIFSDIDFIFAYETFVQQSDIRSEKTVFSELYDYYSLLNNYPSYVQQVRNNIELLKGQPIWSLYSLSKKEYYQKLDEMYEKLSDVTPYSINYFSFEKLLLFNSNIILLIAGVYLFFVIFHIEEKGNMNELLLVTKNGRTKTTIGKLVLLVTALLSISVLATLFEVLFAQTMYGSIDWSAPVQSVPSLSTVPYKVSLFDWYCIRILLHSLGIIVLSLFFGMFYFLFESKKFSVFLYTSILILSAFTYITISDNMAVNWIKYVNPFALTQLTYLLEEYRNLELFEYSMPIVNLSFILLIVLTILSIITILRKRLTIPRLNWATSLHAIKNRFRYYDRLNIFGFELHKLFVVHKGWLIIVLIIVLQGYFTYQTVNNKSLQDNQQQLSEYYSKNGGELNEEKIDWIEAENLKYQLLQNGLLLASKDYQMSKISQDQYYGIVDLYIEQSSERNIFLQFYDHYQQTRSKNLVYPKGYQALFSMNTDSRDLRSTYIMMIGLVFLLSPIVAQDKEENLNSLFKITKNGNLSLRVVRIKIGAMISIVSVFLFTLIDYLSFSYLYSMESWEALIVDVVPQNFALVSQYVLNLALWQYFALLILVRLFAIILIALFIILCSTISKSIVVSYLISISVLFAPIFIRNLNPSALNFVSPERLLMGNTYLFGSNNLGSLMIFVIIFISIYVFLVKHDLD
jgi:hypothetical protein